ncbi:MAG: hypothetical protein MJZ03_04595 [archaeon]|nr:hypothetical protein [archaeon]
MKIHKRKTFKKNFSTVVGHTNKFAEKLSKRDINREQYFKYSRSQGLKYVNSEKLSMSTVITTESEFRGFRTILFSTGIVITSKGEHELEEAENTAILKLIKNIYDALADNLKIIFNK